jgi:hypothetical protein
MKLRAFDPKSTFRWDHKYKPANLEVWNLIIETLFLPIRESRRTTRVGRNSNSYQMFLPLFCSFHLSNPRFISQQFNPFRTSAHFHLSSKPQEQTQTSLRHQHQHPPSRILVPSMSPLTLRDSTLPPWLLPMQTLGLPGVYWLVHVQGFKLCRQCMRSCYSRYRYADKGGFACPIDCHELLRRGVRGSSLLFCPPPPSLSHHIQARRRSWNGTELSRGGREETKVGWMSVLQQ